MQVLERIVVAGASEKRHIDLVEGDLTRPGEPFDILVVSAFFDDYLPTEDSLIGGLDRRGLSVEALADDKELDLRDAFACWLSKDLRGVRGELPYRRLLVFEPQHRGAPPEQVGGIFRALAPVLGQYSALRTLAMPVVAAGNQGYAVDEMLEALVSAAVQWLRRDFPLQRLAIAVRDGNQVAEARRTFWRLKSRLKGDGGGLRYRSFEPPSPDGASSPGSKGGFGAGEIASPGPPEPDSIPPSGFFGDGGTGFDERAGQIKPIGFDHPGDGPVFEPLYDVFLSYARENATEVEIFEQELKRQRPGLRIFLDRKELDIGCAWQPEIFETIDYCRRMATFFSPHYLGSDVCKEEFNIGWIRSRRTRQTILFPVYVYSAPLPTYMTYRNYFDCREGDQALLRQASQRLIQSL